MEADYRALNESSNQLAREVGALRQENAELKSRVAQPSPETPEQFETICSRCSEPHMVDGDTLVGAFCPKCQALSVYGTNIPAAPQPVLNLMEALRNGLENALKPPSKGKEGR